MVWKYLRKHTVSLVVATALALILGLLSALLATLIGPSLQILMNNDSQVAIGLPELFGERMARLLRYFIGDLRYSADDLWQVLPAFLISLSFLKGIFSLSQWFLWELTGEQISKHLRADLIRGFLFLDPALRGSDDTISEKNLSALIATDIKLLRDYVVHFYGGLPRESLQISFYVMMLILLSPKLFVIFMMGVFPVVFIVSRLGKKIRKRTISALQDFSILTEWLEQRLMGIETIKHYRTESYEAEQMTKLNQTMYKRFLKAERTKAMTTPVLEAVTSVAIAIVFYFAFQQVYSGAVTGSVQLSFFAVIAMLAQSAGKLGKYVNSNREGYAAIHRLMLMQNFFEQRTKVKLRKLPIYKANSSFVECNSLYVKYPGQTKYAIEDFNFIFQQRHIYCICGPSGAGKSTLFNAILGLVPCERGEIKIGLQSTDEAMPIAYIPQEIKLAPDTVINNVYYPDPVADRQRVIEALKKVGLQQFSHDEGLNIFVSDWAKNVSGGQAQRIKLARLAYFQSPIVLFDEGTSALDPEIEKIVFQLLRELADHGSIIIMIAHRPSAQQFADVVVELRDGKQI